MSFIATAGNRRWLDEVKSSSPKGLLNGEQQQQQNSLEASDWHPRPITQGSIIRKGSDKVLPFTMSILQVTSFGSGRWQVKAQRYLRMRRASFVVALKRGKNRRRFLATSRRSSPPPLEPNVKQPNTSPHQT
jgi:pSer/pThr/pTyr-binding forkhead associated (FHA) protein